MADRPPAGFLEILEADGKNDQQLYNIIGLCVDYFEPAQSRGTDLTMKMQLWDTTCLRSPGLGSDGMAVRCFYKERGLFPPVQEIGDVVIVRSIKSFSKGSQKFAIASYLTTWSVISGQSLLYNTDPEFRGIDVRGPSKVPKPDSRPSLAEFKYARALVEAKDTSTLRGPPKSTALDVATIITQNGGKPPPMRNKYRALKDIHSPREVSGQQFVDLVGEVRRVYSGFVNPVEMQLTDYTEHPQLYEYRESDNATMQNMSWGGPWGRMTITINAWDQLGEYVMNKVRLAEIDLGTYVRVTNVQIKMDKKGSLMQGHIRGGSTSGTSITIHGSKDAEHIPELKELIVRKRDYNIERKTKAIGFVQDGSTKKRSYNEEEEQPDTNGGAKKKSKSALKKEKRNQEKAKAKAQTGDHSKAKDGATKIQSNQHVRCEAITIPLTSIDSIMQGELLERTTPSGNPYRLPFQNCKYRSKVQVIDFFPDSLEDFATPYRNSDYETLSDYESADDEDASIDYARRNNDGVKWKWHFLLMVQDPTTPKTVKGDNSTILLQVAGQDGDYLLNMEACDLRDQPQELAKLKEKLFVLWGDLEEKKTETGKSGSQLAQDENVAVSSKPFECLIKEYGVKTVSEHGADVDSEWDRMFRIFGTNIG